MESTEKEKIINNLFAIRAGMSLIAQQYDTINQINNSYNSQKMAIAKQEDLINKVVSNFGTIGTYNSKYRNLSFNLKSEQGFNSYIDLLKKGVKRKSWGIFLFVLLAIASLGVMGLCVWGLIAGAGMFISSCDTASFDGILGGLALVAACLLVGFGALFLLIFVFDDDGIKMTKIEKEEFSRKLGEAKNLRDRLIKLEEQSTPLQARRLAEIKPHKEEAQKVYNAFYSAYGGILDVRDWKYIDLIIFYFQTGRADSIKEALQQVDRQVQTQAIVDAVNNAAKAICNTIRAESRAIQDTMIDCTNRIVANQRIMIAQGALQNALLAYMSTSSQQLEVKVRSVTG